ncbi:alpha/beta fold hydrolase [Nocardia sp. BMG111209]|uniref:alpha/beta fold hydrolase n=1 Tax=Nocardia sp. BMG111209 TaxID=1160137 RepID=UPI00037B657B|nr:alpha/beta hydrolase [Nocardia sp. BMG111209]
MHALAGLLASQFTVVHYDRRGRGGSGDTGPYAVEREIEDLEALITVAGGSAHVFGLSSGAALSLRAAAAGLNITRLALYEPPFVAIDKSGHQPPADSADVLTRLIAADRRAEAATFYLTRVIGAPAIFPLLMRVTPMWPKMKGVAASLPYDAAIMGDFEVPARQLSTLTVPTLVIGGAKSPANLRQATRAVADTLPDGRALFLEGQNHNVSARTLAPLLHRFFRTTADRA